MMRLAFTMRLKPDALPEYKYHHDNLWPELAADIERAGIRHITTFQRGLDLFLVSEVDDEEAWQRLWSGEVHQRWAEVMRPLMQMRDDGIVETAELAEVFHFQAGTDRGPWAPTDEDIELAREPGAEIALVEPSSEAALADASTESIETFDDDGLDEDLAESPGGAIYAESPWQESSAHSAGEGNGVTLVEAIVVAVVEDEPRVDEPASVPVESPAPARPSRKKRPARRAAGRKNPAAKPAKRKTAKPAKKRSAKKKKAAQPAKKPAGKKAAPKKKAAKKKSPPKKRPKKKTAKKR